MLGKEGFCEEETMEKGCLLKRLRKIGEDKDRRLIQEEEKMLEIEEGMSK